MRAGLVICLAACALVLAAPPADAGAATSLGKKWHRGAIMSLFGGDRYAGGEIEESLTALRATRSRRVTFYVSWYMRDLDASSMSPDADGTVSDRTLKRAIAKARALGMAVTLSPIVRVHGGEWQGRIRPRSVATWFRRYASMLRHYELLGERSKVSTFVMGAELPTMSRYKLKWERLIRKARKRFSGRLTYTANQLSDASSVRFWRRLDYIGMSAYMPLSSRDPNPSVRKLARAWRRRGYVRDIEALRKRHDRPVLFTELGYGSRMGTAIWPWATVSGANSQTPQRRAYEAAYRVWSRFRWFRGIYWWYWPIGPFDPSNGTHSPRGKAAERTMRSWNTARR